MTSSDVMLDLMYENFHRIFLDYNNSPLVQEQGGGRGQPRSKFVTIRLQSCTHRSLRSVFHRKFLVRNKLKKVRNFIVVVQVVDSHLHPLDYVLTRQIGTVQT